MASVVVTAIVIGTVAALRPPTADATVLALLLAYLAAGTHPIRVRHVTRSNFIVVVEAVVAVGVLAVAPIDLLWVAIVGSLLTPVLVRPVSPVERMRVAAALTSLVVHGGSGGG